VSLRVCEHVCLCVCVPVAILAQGTNFLLFWNGIEVSILGCNPVFANGKYTLYLVNRYLCKIDDPVLSTHRVVYS
jgi:hypothetical protein